MPPFAAFKSTFQVDAPANVSRSDDLVEECATEFGIQIPQLLREFWRQIPTGYYGDNELYIFGLGEWPRHSLLQWNNKRFWSSILNHPSRGGPLILAETCFGVQIGVRWELNRIVPFFFDVDIMESYQIVGGLEALFEEVLPDRYSITDRDRYQGVTQRFGSLPQGKHFAPVISPIIGGTGDASNFALEDPVVHMASAIAIYDATKNVPPGTGIHGLILDWP